MANVTGIGTTWNLPNYAGELFTSDPRQTPFLSMIGGLTGGRQTTDYEFPTAVTFNLPDPAQPGISESASATAPSASEIARAQETNVVQIHQEVIDLTYAKLSNGGRLAGLNTAGAQNSVADEKAWQVQQRLRKIARDVEYSFVQGEYQKATSASVANKTRGMLELTQSDSGATIVASTTTGSGETATTTYNPLTTDMIKQLFLMMADNGAYFDNMVLFCGSYQKQAITALYESQLGYNKGAERNVGGMNVTEIENDFCKLGIVWDRFVPADTILVADLAHVYPVFQAVPGKGVLFEEPLAKVGASDRIQLYGQIGLAHGPAFLHGSITGLKHE